ncbi:MULTISPECIES: DUF3850 domain-containing protein [Enterococcus]|uniref:DUF3850 domain-containing protein n=1 Tax=Enterococcus TaxID=1350 RepID=UPI0009BDF2D3|nr:DUF3850 domain-containing protein [Enterococcus faecalis]EAC5408132.1 DUF3850 domain-containing protein [Listeria monocytogenes]EGO6037401.1 DUF3850 domain-containing protein [Enterococcus faecalis]EGO6718369.1 DUF3850 domain-containing protein [Enterococcus faecalis]EJX7953655.1 DUF3850 domain-containing protein [Enterococcus faecalis]EJY9662807.1 DUF3850 domain-containing protein [Enterococcus faecalis]
MNKQELIEELECLVVSTDSVDYLQGANYAVEKAISLAEQLDEPKKVVVPEYVDQWLNYCIGAEMTLIEALETNKNKLGVEVYAFAKKTSDWLLDSMNQQIFAKIWAGDSYEVKGAMIHELKIKPEYFKAVESGMKKFEIRKNDRDYNLHDLLILQEYKNGKFTGNKCSVIVTYITDYAQKADFVVLGIELFEGE